MYSDLIESCLVINLVTLLKLPLDTECFGVIIPLFILWRQINRNLRYFENGRRTLMPSNFGCADEHISTLSSVFLTGHKADQHQKSCQ